eukprot:TRINITY_DN1759_c1_g1_i1.p1 TRINITY_DN1759_c1_g1~~TRINITY_DN1759_c1_g1_i1.p1  ORF type:complete len:451 (+),score=67.10 TRINITY_DN1759_c1_g1_i1:62-1354(+)
MSLTDPPLHHLEVERVRSGSVGTVDSSSDDVDAGELSTLCELFPDEEVDDLKGDLLRYGSLQGAVDGVLNRIDRMKREYNETGPAVVYLNIYNLAAERAFDRVGIGLYHTGVEVYGKEWGFGGSSDPEHYNTTGVFWVVPKTAASNFTKQLVLGEINMSHYELYTNVIRKLQAKWTIGDYHVMKRNCNHFSDYFCGVLNVKRPPPWVNRAARWGDTLVPDRVVNYFLNKEEVPEARRDEMMLKKKERRKKNRKRFWQKTQPDIVGEYDGVEFRVGDKVRYSVVAGVKGPEETGHTTQVLGEPPVKGMVILGAVDGKWDVVKLHYPRQTFREIGSFNPVTLGPFESTCHVSYLQHDTGTPPSSPTSPGDVVNPPESHELFTAEAAELAVILPQHPLYVIQQALADHNGDMQLALDVILSMPQPGEEGVEIE